MLGGQGNDTYIVDNIGDNVVENTGEGTDIIQSSVSFQTSIDAVSYTHLTLPTILLV